MVVELPYSLHTRYASIAISWTVILIPPVFINLGLFYGLWYGKPEMDRIAGTDLPRPLCADNLLTSPTVLTIPTAVLGIFTAISIIERVWKLIQPSPKFRPLDSPRQALDIFQWGYFGALILISTLISTTLARGDIDDDDHELQIRLISLPASVLMFYLATLTLLSLVLNALNIALPFHFGSVEAGNVVRPAIYYIVEDVVAVDGFGGIEYRQAFMRRYENSPLFRQMIQRLSVVWTLAFFTLAAIFAAFVFRLPKAAVYAVGWAGPFPLGGLMALGTVLYVQSSLKEERRLEKGTEDADPASRHHEPLPTSGEDETTPLLNSAR